MATNNIFNLPSAEQIDELNTNLFNLILAEEEGENNLNLTSWSQIQRIVRSGAANKIFSIGDQLICQRGNDTLVWDVIGIDYDTPADPQFTHSLTLQLHDCLPTPLQFDAPEAFYYAENGLEAGTYHFTIDSTDYQFTLDSDVAAGGQLILNFTGSTPTSLSVSETVGGDFVKDTNGIDNLTIAVTAGSGGKELSASGLNHINRVRNGSNNYKESAIRQWLRSNAAAGSVWTPQTNFDRPPAWKDTAAGFMNGMDADFLAAIGNVTKVTARNTVTDGGGSDTTTEKFFLLSRSEVYGGLENSVNEGTPYPYYADYSQLGNTAGIGADSNRIKALNNPEQNYPVKNWWLRTPMSSSAISVRYIKDTGAVDNVYARAAIINVAPACCVI